MRKLCYCVAAYAAVALFSSAALPAAGRGDPSKLCADQTGRFERADRIPDHLLTAISLAESGRWDTERRASVAWPWTVTAEGEGRFLPTKAAAIAEVRALKAQGVRNIDVGCMQVNLHYHPEAFATLEQAFDPASNVAYASQYLREMFEATRSWTEAAAYYHSMNPERNRDYRLKVVRLWTAQRQAPAGAGGDAAPDATPRPVAALAPIDPGRTALLNARFKEPGATRPAAEPASVGPAQVAAWRDGRPSGPADSASVRRAIVQRLAGQRLAAADQAGDEFAVRRRAQLQAWRDALARGAAGR